MDALYPILSLLHMSQCHPATHSATQIIMFSDLECDYINPIDLCNKLNQVRFSNPSLVSTIVPS